MYRCCQLALLSALLVVGLTACHKRPGVSETTTAMMILPEGASPGMVVRVTATQPIFSASAAPSVEIGGQRASISRVISDTEAEVLVPNARDGLTTITVADAKKSEKESADFTVLPAQTQQLVLRIKDNRVELVAVHATSGESSGHGEPGSGPQLSFDILNAAGAVVYTGAIPHPGRQRMEVFDGPDASSVKIRREKMEHEAVFAIKVPKVPGEATIKFFEAPAGMDLRQARGREGRKYLSEIKVKTEGK